MSIYVDSSHLQNWIDSGKGKLVPVDVALRFGDYLNSLKWIHNRLDWSDLRVTKANLAMMCESEVMDWVRQTTLGSDSYIIFWFCANQPCIACEVDFGVKNIDYAYWKAPGIRYMFGGDFKGDKLLPHFDHLLEYDGGENIIAMRA